MLLHASAERNLLLLLGAHWRRELQLRQVMLHLQPCEGHRDFYPVVLACRSGQRMREQQTGRTATTRAPVHMEPMLSMSTSFFISLLTLPCFSPPCWQSNRASAPPA